MLNELIATPLFGVFLTLAAYALAQILYRRTGSIFFNPVALSISGIILFLLASGIPYDAYAVGGRYVLFLLGPSVVALAVPLYVRRQEIWKRRGPISVGIFAGAVSSVVSASGLAWLLGGSRDVVLSLAPKSVTTPIAISIVEKIGGIAPLTAALVVLTGCLGAICGPEFCRFIGIRSEVATGLAVGTASHGIGTARMLEVSELGGAVAGLAIGLNGLVTAFLLPLLFVLAR
ncbi:putative murein hydrolase (TIGR00659 family) [Geothermobacter ehrlichii]|uniref:Putative murein hydrolase (TIGR00659 family) n=1 Tax=Geothermobacter ehrlichii TaxID=213224 RepID=A0A5D3WP38_9BACT|nr:LrgB family protein [Geothermobacter ehrlichii]TYP00104.1 putative murein hydrolase (TIGR00659 family) [Geothermobacter ehrlichii]